MNVGVFRSLVIVLLSTVVSFQAWGQSDPRSVNQKEADRIWAKYVETGEFEPVSDKTTLRRLWEDHVKVELLKVVGRDAPTEEAAVTNLKWDWTSLLFSNWVEKPETTLTSRTDVIAETVQLCPDAVTETAEGSAVWLLTRTPDRIITTTLLIVEPEVHSFDLQPSEGFVQAFAATLRLNVLDKFNPAGSASLAALAVLAEEGRFDPTEVDALLSTCAADDWRDPIVKRTAKAFQVIAEEGLFTRIAAAKAGGSPARKVLLSKATGTIGFLEYDDLTWNYRPVDGSKEQLAEIKNEAEARKTIEDAVKKAAEDEARKGGKRIKP